VVEIGAGRGAMTSLLAERCRHVAAIELDPQLVGYLQDRLGENKRVEILQGDILNVSLEELCRRHGVKRAFVFGNLPYYITSPILHHVLELEDWLSGMAFVVQREVAERIAAESGSRAYGYLSVLVQASTIPRIVFSIPPGAFSPPPSVTSELVTLEMRTQHAVRSNCRGVFLRFAKLCFTQKRKTLLNNLLQTYGAGHLREAFRRLELSENTRAEGVTVESLARLFEALERLK